MPENLNIDTTDLERVEKPAPRVLPPLDPPTKSPFYRGQVPTTAIVNPDAVRNFQMPVIPAFRIVPPQPLTLAGSGTNAPASTSASTFNILRPPAPTISQTLSSIPIGYQFAFFQVQLPLGSQTTIANYKIYRSTSSSNNVASVIQTISHNPANNGVPIVVQDAQPNGVTQFYWVSAISTAGIESTLTPAQSGNVTNNAGFNSSSQLAGTFHNNPVNVAFAPTSTTTLSNNGISTVITIAAATNQFAPGGISYSSGSVDPGTFGTVWIFTDDPQFQGGAVIYQSTTSAPFSQVGAEGRLPVGKITTALGSTKTGGGYTGGTTGAGAGGGRGYIQ
jgi:hypothetical protein